MEYTIYRTKSSVKIEHDEIVSLQVHYGCSGTMHALWIAKEYRNYKGKVVHVENIGDVIVNACDGSCKQVENLGGFLVDTDPA